MLFWSSVAALTNEESAAGLPEEAYLRRAAEVTKLELFMNTMDNPEYLADFPNLVELAIHLETLPMPVPQKNHIYSNRSICRARLSRHCNVDSFLSAFISARSSSF